MTRLTRLEKAGYKVLVSFNGTVYAENGSIKLQAPSITKLHNKVFGY